MAVTPSPKHRFEMTVDAPAGAQWVVSRRGDVVAVGPAASIVGRGYAC